MGDGAIVRVRRHGRRDGTRMFVSNGNGFAIDGYVPFWGPLAERFDVIAFDMRNHGANPLATSGPGRPHLRPDDAGPRAHPPGGGRPARALPDHRRVSFDVGAHGHEARHRDRLPMGGPHPLRSTERASSGP